MELKIDNLLLFYIGCIGKLLMELFLYRVWYRVMNSFIFMY